MNCTKLPWHKVRGMSYSGEYDDIMFYSLNLGPLGIIFIFIKQDIILGSVGICHII